jgi:hypothetical protein
MSILTGLVRRTVEAFDPAETDRKPAPTWIQMEI